MGLVWEDELDKIDLESDEEGPQWAKIKRRMASGDRIAVQELLARGITVGADGNPSGEIDASSTYAVAEYAALEIMVKEWSFRHHGDPVPVTLENLRRLSEDDLDTLKRAVDVRAGRRTEEEKKDSSTSSMPPTGTGPESDGPIPETGLSSSPTSLRSIVSAAG